MKKDKMQLLVKALIIRCCRRGVQAGCSTLYQNWFYRDAFYIHLSLYLSVGWLKSSTFHFSSEEAHKAVLG